MAEIKCSNCAKEYEIDSKLEWKKVKCSNCGNIFILSFPKENNEILEEKLNKIDDKEHFKEDLVEKEEDNVIKPHKLSYILLWSPVLLLLIITIISFFISLPVWLVFLIFTSLIYFWYNIKYKKEEYIITDRKIIFHYWNLFSDNSVEVNLDKVTQVSSILWFIQYKIFWTWNLIVKTAWSDNSIIKFKNINSTMDIYENIQTRMRKNWFHLLKDKLVQTTKPHWLWIVWEIFWKLIANFLIVFVWLWNLFAGISTTSGWNLDFLMIIPVVLFVVIIVLLLVVTYLDLKRRKYEVYTDSIFYTEWFLTKHYSFLPMESVADTENTQSFFSKIFWLHDVVVSSAWSNNKVVFKNMLDWEQMMKNIKYLKDNIIMWEKDILKWEENNKNSLIWYKDKIEKPLDYDKEFKGEYKMSMLKSIVVILPLLLFPPAFLAALIWQVIRVMFTKYIVEESSIEKKFEFLSKKHNSFSVEKITGVIIKQSILDRVLWTCSISFWSIGSGTNIIFSNIKKTEDLEKNILAKVWIKLEEDKKRLPIKFNLFDYLKSIIGSVIFVLFIITIIFIVSVFVPELWNNILIPLWLFFIFIFFIIYIYKIIYYSKFRYIQNISANYLESISWIFFIEKDYVSFRNVKWIKSIKYPLTNTWNLIFNVAWEQVAETKSKKWFIILSNKVKLSFVSNVFDTHKYFDNILNESKIDSSVISTAKQDIWNSIIGFIILGVMISIWVWSITLIASIAVIIFFILIIWLIIWIIKVKYYNFEKDRVLFSSWIIYKKKHTILYNRFNFIEKNQWFINKIFKNWTVKIYTLWSWSVEMLIKNIPNFKEIYDLLKKD